MTPDKVRNYRRDRNFQNNESIWVLKTIDKLPSKDIGKQFGITAEDVDITVELHQKYWEACLKSS